MSEQELYLFFSGEASRRQEEKILEWIEMDPANRAEFMRSRKVFDLLMLSDHAGILLEDPKPFRIPRWAKELVRTAAAVALIVFMGHFFFNRYMDELSSQTNTVVVPAGQRANITLPDGTEVHLNSMTELTYPMIFRGKERRVKLKGEGFFDVTHDKRKPFVVDASQYDVTVLGTRFDVISHPSQPFSVSVLDGRVEVAGSEEPGNALLLCGGYEAREIDGFLVRNEISNNDIFRWREGLLCFRNSSLAELFERFEYCYGVPIDFDPTALPEAEFSGKFRISDGIFHALNVLQRDVAFSYMWDEEQNVIYIKGK